MRHRKDSRKLSRQRSHRKAMLINMAKNLFIYQSIKTTLAKAKESRRLVEHLITLGKKDTLYSRREAYSVLTDRTLVKKLFLEVAPLFKERKGGFTRIVRLNNRAGDGASIVILELVEKIKKEEKPKTVKEKTKEEKPIKDIPKREEKPEVQHPKEDKLKEEKPKEGKPKEEKPKEQGAKPVTELRVEKAEPKKKPGFMEGIRKLFKK